MKNDVGVSPPQMQRAANGEYQITGNLIFSTARAALKASNDWFTDASPLTINLSGVQSADSAGLALLIEWYRLATRQNQSIRFVSAPAQLRTLAQISDLDEVLPFV